MKKLKIKTFNTSGGARVTFMEVDGQCMVAVNMTVDECIAELEKAVETQKALRNSETSH